MVAQLVPDYARTHVTRCRLHQVEAHLALLMPRAQYGGQASASVAVTGAAGLLPTEAEDQGKLVKPESSTYLQPNLNRWLCPAP